MVFDQNDKKVADFPASKLRITGTAESDSHKNLKRLTSLGGGYQAPLDLAAWDCEGNKVGYSEAWDYRFYYKDERVEVKEVGTDKLGNPFIGVRGKETGDVAEAVHVDGWSQFKKGDIIDKGQLFCKVAIKARNGGYPAHLHYDQRSKGGKTTVELISFKEEVVDAVVGWEKKYLKLKGELDGINKELSTEKTKNRRLQEDVAKDAAEYSQLRNEKLALEEKLKRLEGVLAEKDGKINQIVAEMEELNKVNQSLKKKRKASLSDFTTSQKLKDYRKMTGARFLNFISDLLEKAGTKWG